MRPPLGADLGRSWGEACTLFYRGSFANCGYIVTSPCGPTSADMAENCSCCFLQLNSLIVTVMPKNFKQRIPLFSCSGCSCNTICRLLCIVRQ
uniref:Uncharacterized protein n=1 Tax=Triticum urartu TaxID=4572 RepID=A0A8R7PD42_TRIUA